MRGQSRNKRIHMLLVTTSTVNFRYSVFASSPSLHCGGLTTLAHLLHSDYQALPHSLSQYFKIHFWCSDYTTTPISLPITHCYIRLRPPSKWFCMILHATPSLPAKWTPLVERKPHSKSQEYDGSRMKTDSEYCDLITVT